MHVGRSAFAVFDEALRRRTLMLSLAFLLLLYASAAVSCYVFDEPRTDGRGEVAASVFAAIGVALCVRTPLRGWRYRCALTCSAAAPVASVLFHDQMTAQIWSVVPMMFFAVFVRTWHPPGPARAAIAVVAASAVAALSIAPAPTPALWLAIYVIVIFAAAEVLGAVNHTLIDAALRDPLTSVWNRAGLAKESARMIEQARQRGDEVAVLVFDVDDFKGVNDRRGHVAGDMVLADLAHRLRSRLPAHSVVGRVGGDEFVAVVSGCDDAAGRRLAAHLVDGHSVLVTAGVAAATASGNCFTELYAAADADLCRRKRTKGRDATTR